MTRHPYTLLDVFTDTPLAGNALAVVHDADGVSDATMLAFARETRLAETTFVQSDDDADYRNRIWTVTEEVPFAGHPSLGTAVAVALERGETSVTYRQRTQVGVQPVSVKRDGDRARASILQPAAEFGPELRIQDVLPALGLSARDGAPGGLCRVVSTGLPALMVPLSDRDAVARARYDHPALDAAVPGGANVYLYALEADEARARMFVTVGPEGEDPATGSAAGPLLAHLHETEGRTELTVRQGVEMGRPSRLDCTLEDGQVRVGGDVIVVATGTLRLP
ncbi:MAG: PhzF family phenazine biosynthesis protein [Solirubrobacterales bacterium]|nr:PhzF family phenazine biosynthesis protein [Solirubrobacterales bacterium]